MGLVASNNAQFEEERWGEVGGERRGEWMSDTIGYRKS